MFLSIVFLLLVGEFGRFVSVFVLSVLIVVMFVGLYVMCCVYVCCGFGVSEYVMYCLVSVLFGEFFGIV